MAPRPESDVKSGSDTGAGAQVDKAKEREQTSRSRSDDLAEDFQW